VRPQLTGEAVAEDDVDLRALYPTHGGHREGSGRKRTVDRLHTIAEAEQRFFTYTRVNELFAQLDRIAMGQLPDTSVGEMRRAAEYLLNRSLGKPTERVEMSGPNGGAIQTASIFATIPTAALTALIDEVEYRTERSSETDGDDRGGEA
jgi:hypothetical protein